MAKNKSYDPNDISDLGNVMFPTSGSGSQSYTSDGFGGLKPVSGSNAGMPSMNQFQGGLMHDLYLQDNLNKANYNQNKNAANMFLNTSNQAAQKFQDPNSSGQQFFDQAQQYSQAGLQDSQKAENRLNKQLSDAGRNQKLAQQNSLAMYDKAIAQSGEGTDKIASAMSAAAARRGSDQEDQMANQMSGALPGTESQLQDASRTNRRDMNESVFSGVSQIQDRANQLQATLLSGKAQLSGSLADSAAQFQTNAAQMGFNANQSKNKFNELSANIAMNNAAFQFQNNQAFMGAVQNIGMNYADMVRQNPIMGVSVMPTLMAMGEISKQYGGSDSSDSIINPNPGAAVTGGTQSSWMPGASKLRDNISEGTSRAFAQSQGLNYVSGSGGRSIRMMGSGGGGSFSSPNRVFDTSMSSSAGQLALANAQARTNAMKGP